MLLLQCFWAFVCGATRSCALLRWGVTQEMPQNATRLSRSESYCLQGGRRWPVVALLGAEGEYVAGEIVILSRPR